MVDPAQIGLVPSLIVAAGIVMVSGLLVPMTRAVPGEFLRYWSYAWTAAAAAVLMRFAMTHAPAQYQSSCLIGYCLGEYLFGFLVWAGCREFATGETFSNRHAVLFLPFAAFGVVLPTATQSFADLYPLHSLILAGLFVFAFAATLHRRLSEMAPTLGLVAMRAALLGLAVLSLHSSAVTGPLLPRFPDYAAEYMVYLPLLHVLFGTLLAFGMVVLASDRMREELVGINRQLGQALAELATAARTDALTGVGNRRAFDEWALPTPGKPPVLGCLAVLDVNDLKPLNDQYGHQVGDIALQFVARALRVQFRVDDPLFRTGGDEFVVVMPGCGAADLAERLRRVDRSLVGLRLPKHPDPVTLTVAWGIAPLRAGTPPMASYQEADAQMYEAKRALKQESGRMAQPRGVAVVTTGQAKG